MKKLAIHALLKCIGSLLIGLLTTAALAQQPVATLTGRVLDAKTGQPVPFATVYINNTTRGTTTDEKGDYRLPNVPVGTVELVGSSLGYATLRQSVRLTDARPRTVPIQLVPADNALATVTVKAKHTQAWARQFRIFSRELLGNRPIARQCRIMNENGLSFTEEKGHLRAQSAEPLTIENKALGYRLIYTLLYFDLHQGQMQFAGTTQFEEMKSTDARQQAQWQANRLKVYKGSLHHLLASLVAGTHEQEGFQVYSTPLALNPGNTSLPLLRTAERQAIGPQQAKALFKPGEFAFERRLVSAQPLEVYYNRIYAGNSPYRDLPYAYSMLLLPRQVFDLTTDGWITQGNGLDVRGYLGDDRLATLLPADWTPADKETLTAIDITSGRTQRADAAQDSVIADTKRQTARSMPLVFVHTDKQLYATGDNLWFSAYVLDPARHLPIAGHAGAALQIQLIAPGGQPALHQWLRLNDGRAAGSLRLADTLAAGTYRLRAYTGTAADEPAFECAFPVQNVRLSGLSASADRKIIGGQANEQPIQSPPLLDVQFLAEGGRWLAGVLGKLGVKVVQPSGRGRAVSGRILDGTGREMARFTTTSLGIGHVEFIPQAGQRYAALFDSLTGADARPIDLPAVEPEGWSLMADAYSDSSRLAVTVRATGRGQQQPVYVTLQVRDQLVYHQKWQLTKGEAHFSLPTVTLPPGVGRLTVWDYSGKARAERLVYVPNRESPVQIRPFMAKSRYAPRDTVLLTIQLRDADNYPVAALWSAAVTDADQLPDDTAGTDLRTYLLLTGGLRGVVESPSSYLQADKLGAIDDLLLTQGWRRLPAYEPADSTDGWTISGRIQTRRGRLLPNTLLTLALEQGSQRLLQSLLTNNQGRFRLSGLMANDTIQVRAFVPGEPDAVVTFDKPGGTGTAPALATPDWNPLAFSLTAARARQLAFPAFYRDSTARLLAELVVKAARPVAGRPLDVQRASIHGNPDKTFVVTREMASSCAFVSELIAKVPGITQLYGRNYSSFGNNTPLYLIDGMAVDLATVGALSPLEVTRIELLMNSAASIYGARGANGVIAIYTRKGADASEATMPQRTAATTLFGFATPREFYVSRYNLPGLPTDADKRDVLYWKPLGQSGPDGLATLQFPLSDAAKKLRLVIQGITTEGTPVFFTWMLPVR